MASWNERIIEEFRANAGRVGGRFEGSPLLLLTTTGARTGLARTTPLVYLADGDRFAVFASAGGSPAHPSWYRNLLANPRVRLEVGTAHLEATASVAEGAERERLWAAQVARMPAFGDYQRAVEREIPVVILTPA
ncbi:MAG: nitroreductase family deazaflavin-dependent oxidoreductase [Thermoleophilia bacterium]